MKRRYTKIDVEIVAALYAEHKNCVKVAKIIDASPQGVWSALKSAGIEVRSRQDHLKEISADPKYRARRAARMKARHADPEFKAAHAARMKARHADPEFKAQLSSRLKRMWAAAKAFAAREGS